MYLFCLPSQRLRSIYARWLSSSSSAASRPDAGAKLDGTALQTIAVRVIIVIGSNSHSQIALHYVLGCVVQREFHTGGRRGKKTAKTIDRFDTICDITKAFNEIGRSAKALGYWW